MVCAPAIPVLPRDAIVKMFGKDPRASKERTAATGGRDMLTTSQLMQSISSHALRELPSDRVSKDGRIRVDFVGIRNRVVPEENAPRKYQLFELLPDKEQVVDVRIALLNGISAATRIQPNRKILRPAPNSNNLSAFAMPIGAVLHVKDQKKRDEYNKHVNSLLERLDNAFFQRGTRSFLLGPFVYNPVRNVLETYDFGR